MRLQNIPTHLITGFLGVGKTSAILSLLAQKPLREKWAVLVNEFGRVGIDGAVYASHGVAVQEVSGGCMCCVSGVPLQVAVNRLLRSARPDRLLIETSGLGHPRGVLKTLRGEHFRTVLDIRNTICLLNPEHLLDARYTQHEIFREQLAICDILAANKTDLASAQAMQDFDAYAAQQTQKLLITKTRFGELNIRWLALHTDGEAEPVVPMWFETKLSATPVEPAVAGYQSRGWKFSAGVVFDHDRLISGLQGIRDIERLKGVVITSRGSFVFNGTGRSLDCVRMTGLVDSRVEIIAQNLNRERVLEIETMLDGCQTQVGSSAV